MTRPARRRARTTPTSLLAFLRDDELGRVVFGVIDAAHQGDLDQADGNWSTDDVEAATDLDHVAAPPRRRRPPGRGPRRPGRGPSWSPRPPGCDDSDEAWEGIDDEVGWYERGPVARRRAGRTCGTGSRRTASTSPMSAERMAADPMQTLRDVATGTVVVEQVAAAEAILVEDGELYLDGACGTDGHVHHRRPAAAGRDGDHVRPHHRVRRRRRPARRRRSSTSCSTSTTSRRSAPRRSTGATSPTTSGAGAPSSTTSLRGEPARRRPRRRLRPGHLGAARAED